MTKPRFSVIIPTLNEEKFLPHLLASLTTQTKNNFEVIVVDGSSKDKTREIVQSYRKKLPLTIHVSKVASLPLQRNLGARESRGEWLVFVDADSVLLPYFFERIQEFIHTYRPKVFTTWAVPDSTNPKDAVYTLFGNIYFEATIIFKRPTAPGPLVIIHRSAFDKVGGYDEMHGFHEDVDMGLRLFRHGISLTILHEALFVLSLRRFRKEGTMKVLNQYIVGLLPVIFFNRTMRKMPGYIMGGHLYDKKKKKVPRALVKKYTKEGKKLLRELFS